MFKKRNPSLLYSPIKSRGMRRKFAYKVVKLQKIGPLELSTDVFALRYSRYSAEVFAAMSEGKWRVGTECFCFEYRRKIMKDLRALRLIKAFRRSRAGLKRFINGDFHDDNSPT